MFVSRESLKLNHVQLVPNASGNPNRYVEVDGAADLVVEIISDSSVTKDTVRLPGAYYDVDINELWLVDVRGDAVDFQIRRRGPSEFECVASDADGFRPRWFCNQVFDLIANVTKMDFGSTTSPIADRICREACPACRRLACQLTHKRVQAEGAAN